MIHYTQVTCLGTIKNSPTPIIVCDLERGIQLSQVINLPRLPPLYIIKFYPVSIGVTSQRAKFIFLVT